MTENVFLRTKTRFISSTNLHFSSCCTLGTVV